LIQEIRKHIPGFIVSFETDYRQGIADSWSASIDDSVASHDWGWKPKLSDMVEDMLFQLIKKKRVTTRVAHASLRDAKIVLLFIVELFPHPYQPRGGTVFLELLKKQVLNCRWASGMGVIFSPPHYLIVSRLAASLFTVWDAGEGVHLPLFFMNKSVK
jgi:hypothetical protein